MSLSVSVPVHMQLLSCTVLHSNTFQYPSQGQIQGDPGEKCLIYNLNPSSLHGALALSTRSRSLHAERKRKEHLIAG